MSECVFCKIVSGEIPSNKIYEDEKVMAFYDIAPKAPVHFLIIPKQHISGWTGLTAQTAKSSRIFETITKVAADLGVDSYRVVTNNGTQAGQTVFHLHFHVLGGGPLGDMA